MSFNLQNLRQEADTRLFSEFRKSVDAPKVTAETIIKENNSQILLESRGIDTNAFDIFLSHSSKDAKIILGILKKLNDLGYRVYVDWVDDPQLDRNSVTEATAEKLRERINQSKSLLYVTTLNAEGSKWMPWELGYMDGKKEKASILPVFETETSSSHTFKGQEYLGIYPYTIEAPTENTKKNKLWVCKNSDFYVAFDEWLNGKKPYKH
ncbi:toll/interleukin-1 receptor domain-containing protein [Flavihumibacter sp. UBA7668]|uniref:toll/interleukin-1 receptor domain-containing protein n=1 Tax=Flavihumibacter sp. UBA7668 TaxID=1946542 RepID=UPI0025BBC141|nr:toll/interleukin-1 receptor domain-containing protein [Flavihumibacter sp. UBA7668]